MIDLKGIGIMFQALFFVLVLGGGERDLRCTDMEREALLKFKKGLIDDYGVLSSWGIDDDKKECCKWKGVLCSNVSGHVTALRLPNYNLGGKINPALLQLRYLNYLDLSGNDFGGDRIPEFIGSMEKLAHLILMSSNFHGVIPPQLGNLTNLRTLDLSENNIWSENLDWLSGLTLLSRLDLSFSNLIDANWLQQMSKLHFLQELYLKGCYLTDGGPSTSLSVNSSSTSLSILDLSENQLHRSSFDWLFNISTSITRLDLSYNQLDGLIPDAFGKLTFLKSLDLSGNMFEDGIPRSLGNLSHLQNLYAWENELAGALEELFSNLSSRVTVSLETVDLSHNQLTGSIPDLRAFSALKKLYFPGNKLTGLVPTSLGELSELQVLDISFNSLEGSVSEANFMKLRKLKMLDLSFNALTMQISPDWTPPFHLDSIKLAYCNSGLSFPSWIQTQSNFSWLDLSFTGISDEVPKWLWSLSPVVEYLNLSHNQISGTIPAFLPTLILDVSVNKFSGPIPLPHPKTIVFQLSQNRFSRSISSICSIPELKHLALLDLCNNNLSGELPNCWEKMTRLQILNLANNSFSGEIPDALGSLRYLVALHLRDNNFFGELPSSLQNCTYLELIDVGGNKLTGNIPAWIGANYRYMTYLNFRQNRFYGSIPPEICSLTQIQLLDLSRNNISGKIPQCFNNFTSLVEKNRTSSFFTAYYFLDYVLIQWRGREQKFRKIMLLKLIDLSSNRLVGNIPEAFSTLRGLISLNLSRNNLTGNIISGIGQIEMLEILDLSENQLSGVIPFALTQLHYLAVLDLANNNLSGQIPSSTQLLTFNASVYVGNSELCGLPLTLCPGDGLSPSFITDQGEEKNHAFVSLSFLQEFCISLALGFIVGFWGIVGSLLLKKSWRSAYFNFLDALGDWLYVRAAIFITKFRRS